MRAARTLFAAIFTAGLLGLAGPSHAATITGNLQIGGFLPINFYDPNNSAVPGTVPPSAYTGFSNANSNIVTASFPITFGFNASTVSDFDSLDVTTINATSLSYAETPSNGEQAPRVITFTASPGFFDAFTQTANGFDRGSDTLIFTVSPDGSTLTLNWTGGLVPQGETTTFSATFAGSEVATPLLATLPLFATGLGAFGLLGWRRKPKAQVA